MKNVVQNMLLAGLVAAVAMPLVAMEQQESAELNEQLFGAAEKGDADAVAQLIKDGADVNKADKGVWTPLNMAVGRGNDKIVDLLIKAGVDVNKVDGWGSTPLNLALAVGRGSDNVVSLLLDAGAKADDAFLQKYPKYADVLKKELKQFPQQVKKAFVDVMENDEFLKDLDPDVLLTIAKDIIKSTGIKFDMNTTQRYKRAQFLQKLATRDEESKKEMEEATILGIQPADIIRQAKGIYYQDRFAAVLPTVTYEVADEVAKKFKSSQKGEQYTFTHPTEDKEVTVTLDDKKHQEFEEAVIKQFEQDYADKYTKEEQEAFPAALGYYVFKIGKESKKKAGNVGGLD